MEKEIRNGIIQPSMVQEVFGFATPQAIYKWQHGTAMSIIDNLVVLVAVLGVAMDDIVVIDTNVSEQISA